MSTVTRTSKRRRWGWAPAPMPCAVCGTPTYARGGAWMSTAGCHWWLRALGAVMRWIWFPPRPVCWKAECMQTLALKFIKLQGLGR